MYHRSSWPELLARTFGHPSCRLAARTADGRLAGVLPLVEFRSRLFGRFAVSLPFVNYGGILADTDEAAAALVDRALALCRANGWSHVEIRHEARERCPGWPARRHKVAMRLALPDRSEALWSGLDRKVRNQVRKAEKSRCVAECGGAALLQDFYRVFAHNMRDLGTPVYPRRLFEEVVRTFDGETRVHIVRADSEPIAAAITVRWRDRVEVPWASALRAHNDKCPNMLLYWAMLTRAIEDGARVFDFGRSTPGQGTYHFKKQWGAQASPLVWEYVGRAGEPPDMSPGNARFNLAIAAWRRLPVPVASALGPLIVRHIP
jgi:FemAB-related protein (PEP-CTERM system-associated)